MNTIYLLGSIRGELIDLLDGFATNGDSLKQIALNYFREHYYMEPEEVTVIINMDEMTVKVEDEADDDTTTFYIHEIERALA